MTEQEVLDYYKDRTVYKFAGTLEELNTLQTETNNSYNYIKVQNTVYFVAQNPVEDPRAQILVVEA